METFRSKFEDYYCDLGNAEQVYIYNIYAGCKDKPQVIDMADFDEMFGELSPFALARKIANGLFSPLDSWFYLDHESTIHSIEIVPEWLCQYVDDMADFYEIHKDMLLRFDSDSEILYADDRDWIREKFNKMTIEDCIEYWNDKATENFSKDWEIHEMDDEDRWNWLSNYLGAWDMLHAVMNAGEDFNDKDRWFFYDVDCGDMKSFSTKQELIEMIGEDFFIENMTNEL